MAKAATEGAGRSLTDYIRAKRREACAVCSLPDELREQVRIASTKKITRDVVLAWLREEHGVSLSRDDFQAHQAAHHDQQEAS